MNPSTIPYFWFRIQLHHERGYWRKQLVQQIANAMFIKGIIHGLDIAETLSTEIKNKEQIRLQKGTQATP